MDNYNPMTFKEVTPKKGGTTIGPHDLVFLLCIVKLISESPEYIKKKPDIQCLFALEHTPDLDNL